MKSPLEAPEKQVAEETSAKPATPSAVIDTSRMAKGKREALELTEASRDPLDDRGSFASNLFIGRYDFARIHPYPEQSTEDRAAAKEFLARLKKYLRENIDADEIDRTGEIPQKNVDDLFAMGAFGVKIPKQYGGLGLSQVNYGRAAMLLGSWDAHRLASRSHCCSLARKNKRKNICRGSRAGRFPRLRLPNGTPAPTLRT
jgi:hypothetical protein